MFMVLYTTHRLRYEQAAHHVLLVGLLTAECRGMDKMGEVVKASTGQLLSIDAPAASPGWP
jgi:hypothetical protein